LLLGFKARRRLIEKLTIAALKSRRIKTPGAGEAFRRDMQPRPLFFGVLKPPNGENLRHCKHTVLTPEGGIAAGTPIQRKYLNHFAQPLNKTPAGD
jgi:hypothetical protein